MGSQRDRPSTPPPPPPSTPKVLVVGATGRVGGLVVEGLVKRGYHVLALARDPTSSTAKALALLGKDMQQTTTKGAVSVVKGDVTELPSLLAPMRGCVACISVAGASRVTRPLADMGRFFLHLVLRATGSSKKTQQQQGKDKKLKGDAAASALASSYPKTHPFQVNYVGTSNLLTAAQQAGCPKFIRVTGLSVGYSAFNPIAILLNLVISFTIRWQLAGEQAIRASGMDYTVLRPGALTNEAAAPDELVVAGDGQGVAVGRISRADVANLCIASLESAKASNATFSCAGASKRGKKRGKAATVAVGGGGSKSPAAAAATAAAAASKAPTMNDDELWPYKMLLRREGRPDVSPLQPKLHRLAVVLFVGAASVCLTGLVAGAWRLGEEVWRRGFRPPAAVAALLAEGEGHQGQGRMGWGRVLYSGGSRGGWGGQS